jgi:hypothetical protein
MHTIEIRRSFAAITIATIGVGAALASSSAAEAQIPPAPDGLSTTAAHHAAGYATPRAPRCFRVLWHTPSGPEEIVICEKR